jgi:hypothetical protein
MERHRAFSILWPAFLVGGAAEMLFFAIFDPRDLALFGEPLAWSRQAIYTVGFFFFWSTCAASAALAVFLQRKD